MIKKACYGALALGLAAVLTPAAQAGTTAKTVVPPVEEKEEKVVSGTLALMVDTHFVSYGADVWASGTDWDSALFHPSIELSLDLGSGFKFILGTWWDVNDKADSNIADAIQEVDVWAGLGYTVDKWSFTLLYQEWMYASQSERIVDFKVAYDTLFSPYILVHGRVDYELGDTGVVGVLGGSYGFEAGPVSFSIPASVAFMTDGFQGGDAGFGYASVGLTASIPVEFLPGDWTLSAGATYYHTDDSVIPNNPSDDFVTGTAGLTLTF